jgi:hypothetical protein
VTRETKDIWQLGERVYVDPHGWGDVSRIPTGYTGWYEVRVGQLIVPVRYNGSYPHLMPATGLGYSEPTSSRKEFPHKCPKCGGAAYVGFTSIDCSNGCP